MSGFSLSRKSPMAKKLDMDDDEVSMNKDVVTDDLDEEDNEDNEDEIEEASEDEDQMTGGQALRTPVSSPKRSPIKVPRSLPSAPKKSVASVARTPAFVSQSLKTKAASYKTPSIVVTHNSPVKSLPQHNADDGKNDYENKLTRGSYESREVVGLGQKEKAEDEELAVDDAISGVDFGSLTPTQVTRSLVTPLELTGQSPVNVSADDKDIVAQLASIGVAVEYFIIVNKSNSKVCKYMLARSQRGDEVMIHIDRKGMIGSHKSKVGNAWTTTGIKIPQSYALVHDSLVPVGLGSAYVCDDGVCIRHPSEDGSGQTEVQLSFTKPGSSSTHHQNKEHTQNIHKFVSVDNSHHHIPVVCLSAIMDDPEGMSAKISDAWLTMHENNMKDVRANFQTMAQNTSAIANNISQFMKNSEIRFVSASQRLAELQMNYDKLIATIQSSQDPVANKENVERAKATVAGIARINDEMTELHKIILSATNAANQLLNELNTTIVSDEKKEEVESVDTNLTVPNNQ